MQLGIFAKTFLGTEPNAVLGAVADAGYRAAHWNWASAGLPSMPDRVPEGVAETVVCAASAQGVALVGLSATWNMAHPDPKVRATGLRRLDTMGPATAVLGTRLVTLCTGTRDAEDQWRYHPDNGTPAAWHDLITCMAEALVIAERHDLVLGIEPELANVVFDAKSAQRLLAELENPRLALVLDPANLFERADAFEQRRLVEEAVDLLGDRIAMAHAKDRDAHGQFVAAGRGVIDFGHFVSTLAKAGFDGPLVTHGLSADEAPWTAQHLTAILAEQGLQP